MAVAHDAASESHTGTTGNTSSASFTWNHVPTGTPRSALVFVTAISATNPVTGVTYGGTAMSAVPYTATDTDTEPGTVKAYFLDNVASGTQAVVVSRTNNATIMYAVCATQTAASACEVYSAGVKTYGGSASNTGASTSSTGTQTTTVVAVDDGSPGTNSVRYACRYTGAASPGTAGTGSTVPVSIDLGAYGVALAYETTPGQGSRNVGFSSAADDTAMIALAVRETPSANVLVTPPALALTLNEQTPVVTASDNKRVVIPAAGGSYSATILADSPTAYWRLGESSGTTANDDAGANDGTYTSSPTLGVSGITGGGGDTAVTFPSGAYVQLTDAAALEPGSSFSLEMWVKRGTIQDDCNFYSKGTGGNFYGMASGAFRIGNDGGTVAISTSTALSDSNWHHVVATYAGTGAGNTKIYIDGTEGHTDGAQIGVGLASNAVNPRIGGYATGGEPCLATIDELAVYQSVLSASQVSAHYAAGLASGLALTGLAPSVKLGKLVAPGTRALTLTGLAPTVRTPRTVTPGARALAVTGLAPTVRTPRLVTPGARALTLTGIAPVVTVSTGANKLVTVPAASLSASGIAPTVRTPRTVTPATRALTLTGLAPSIGANRVVTPPTATLALTSLIPAVRTPRVVTPAARALALSTLAPQARTPRVVTPSPLGLTTTLYAPVVTATGAPLIGGYPPTGYAYASAPRGAAGSPVPTGGAGMTGPSGTASHASPTGAGGRNV